MEDEFEELQCLFQVSDILTLTKSSGRFNPLIFIEQNFDRDKDGVLNSREFQAILKCLGLHLKIEQVIKYKTCSLSNFTIYT